MGRTEDREPLLQIRDVTKRFGALIANDRIHMNIYRGEIHAVLGENGAGKSTLMKMLYGLYPSDGGEVAFEVQLRHCILHRRQRRLASEWCFKIFD